MEKVYVFNIESRPIQEEFVPLLQEKIQSKAKNRFEHVVLDTALGYILEKTKIRFTDIESGSLKVLEILQQDLKDENFERLLHFKKELSTLGGNVKEISEIIEDILNDDDEIAELYLQKGFLKKDTEEVESILENYLEQIEDISHQIFALDENIDDTQEIITLKMARLRNEIIRFDLWLTSLTAILALLALITGFYGMNIKNHLEQTPSALYIIGGILILLGIITGIIIYAYLKRKKIF
jgi:magnesium transporter